MSKVYWLVSALGDCLESCENPEAIHLRDKLTSSSETRLRYLVLDILGIEPEVVITRLEQKCRELNMDKSETTVFVENCGELAYELTNIRFF